jgi:hypothetical protein
MLMMKLETPMSCSIGAMIAAVIPYVRHRTEVHISAAQLALVEPGLYTALAEGFENLAGRLHILRRIA